MLNYFFQKALREDISPSEFMNVIRIILHKAPTHTGADGEQHYSVVNKRGRDLIAKLIDSDSDTDTQKLDILNADEDLLNEENEIQEILATYKPQQSVQPLVRVDDSFKKISNQLKNDNKHFALIDEYSIDDSDDEFDMAAE